MENILVVIGEILDVMADWVYSLTSGLAAGDVSAPDIMKK